MLNFILLILIYTGIYALMAVGQKIGRASCRERV